MKSKARYGFWLFWRARTCPVLGIVVWVAAVLALPPILHAADTTLTVCDEATLRAALDAGGTVKLACDGTIPLTNTLVITKDVVLDATGRNVTLDGQGAVRVFQVQTNVQFTLLSVTVAHGRADCGGGILNNGGKLTLLNSSFFSNEAVGNDTNKLDAIGGGIYSHGGQVIATNCVFTTNMARRGTTRVILGVPYPAPDRVFAGFEARGGAIFLRDGALTLAGCRFSGNEARGGLEFLIPTFPSNIKTKGRAFGGALFLTNSIGQLTQCRFETNVASSPENPTVANGVSYGADVSGGAIHQDEAGLLAAIPKPISGTSFVPQQALTWRFWDSL